MYSVLLFIDGKERLKTKSPFTLPKKTVRRCLPTPSRFFFANSASLLTPVCFLIVAEGRDRSRETHPTTFLQKATLADSGYRSGPMGSASKILPMKKMKIKNPYLRLFIGTQFSSLACFRKLMDFKNKLF